jgi:hypothetical protein
MYLAGFRRFSLRGSGLFGSSLMVIVIVGTEFVQAKYGIVTPTWFVAAV